MFVRQTRVQSRAAALLAGVAMTAAAFAAQAQQAAPADDHSQHNHVHMAPAAKPEEKAGPAAHDHAGHGSPAQKKPAKKTGDHADHAAPAGAAAPAHDAHGGMKGFLGPYGMSREGSGTSWLPDATPHEGIHGQAGDWSTMWHALINGVYDRQNGARGGSKTFVGGMVMGMAQRPVGEGTFGLKAMLSPEPFMGPSGYPLLLASGETADGRTHLIDRQHPHDLFMELAASYSHPLGANASAFVYAGLPGEPALGPPAFMHRTSGADIPEAPITHHWLDSTHITFGVVTAGVVLDKWKIEGSSFRGREPDQHRYDIEAPKLDSYSGRLSFNPTREWSMQVSWGRLNSPEGLNPGVNEDRFTASATYTRAMGGSDVWSTTAAYGRKVLKPGDALDGFLVESAYRFAGSYTLFVRAERVQENELGHDIAGLDGRVFTVNKISLGGIYDIPLAEKVKFGVGALFSQTAIPGDLRASYGGNPTGYMLFARLKVM